MNDIDKAKYERLNVLLEEERRKSEAEKNHFAEMWPPSYPPPIEFRDPDIISKAARLIRLCESELKAMRALRNHYSDPRKQEMADLEEWANDRYYDAVLIGMRVRQGGSKGGKAKTGTSKASDSQQARFLAELERAKGPTYNARVQTAMRRSGWPLSLDSARRLGERAGLK